MDQSTAPVRREGIEDGLRVLIVSGIWPPDVGGPASHAPDLADALTARGHTVEVVTTASSAPPSRAYPVRWIPRYLPAGARHLLGAELIRRRAGCVDVVYTTGVLGRSVVGATLARRPLVVKLTGDPAFERARRWNLTRSVPERFETERGLRTRLLRAARNAMLARAAHVFCPSAYLRDLAVRWGIDPRRFELLPNPVPALPPLTDRGELRRRLGIETPALAFAGRLTAQKSLTVALEALARTDGVALLVAGDGEERSMLERRARDLGLARRVNFLGPQPRERVIELLRAVDGALLSSSWENSPHMVLEALAAGTPVLATAVGGVAEIVTAGHNGLLVESGNVVALAGAIARYFSDASLRAELQRNAAPSVARFSAERVHRRIEEVLRRSAGRSPDVDRSDQAQTGDPRTR